MTDPQKRNVRRSVLDAIETLATNFVYYDRKGDEVLSIDCLNDAVSSGVISVDEMVAEFRKHLENTFKEPQ